MRTRVLWPALGLTSVLLAFVVPVKSYGVALLQNSGRITIGSTATHELIGTPDVVPGQGSPVGQLTLTVGGRSVLAQASVPNHTANTIVLESVTSASTTVVVSAGPTHIAAGQTGQIPLYLSALADAAPGPETVSLVFHFTWPGGQAVLKTSITVLITSPNGS